LKGINIQQQNRKKFYRSRGPRVNHYIRAEKIKLIDHQGEMLGEFSVGDGIKKAKDLGLDLVEISPNTKPPICKILDLGKYKYQQQKKQNQQKKKQKISVTKEVRFRPGIDDHDYQIKMKQIQKFLSKGDKVKITLRWKGREFYGNRDLGKNLFNRIKEEIKDFATIEQEPKMLGRQLVMVLNSIN
tara:strand:+ start:7271 stop:7828 length:558 start_codon:yes stop_codon:yes gene_type:complete